MCSSSFGPLRPPTCWEILGFAGPTNRHNIDVAFSQAMRRPPTMGFLVEAYRKCVKELDDEAKQET